MKHVSLAVFGLVAVVVLILTYSAVFTVHQTQMGLVLQLGSPVRVIKEPGLNFKLPFVQNVVFYDRRILDLDPPVVEVPLDDQKRINLDAFARYRIVEPLEYKKKALTDANFRQVFGGLLNAAVRAEVGKVLLGDMLSEKRAEVMQRIVDTLKRQAPNFGIEVVDLRIGRTDLPEATSNAVYSRMQSERIAAAAQIRAEGSQIKQRIEAEADKARTVILAEARKTAQILEGDGIAEQTRILGEAYGRDPEFFQFYRSMEAYKQALGEGDTMVLSPDSEFFRYFGKLPNN